MLCMSTAAAAKPCSYQAGRFRQIRRRHTHSKRKLWKAAVVEPSQLAALAADPVLEVVLLTGSGAVCAKQGLLSTDGRRILSGLVMNVFTPALLFSKLGASVDIDQAVRLWPLAANMLACHAAGLGLGWLQNKVLSVPATLSSQVLVMTALGNVGNLPLVLVPALLQKPGVWDIVCAHGGGGSSSSTCNTLISSGSAAKDVLSSTTAAEPALAYIMIGFFCASLIQFPLGYLLLQPKQQQQQQDTGNSASAAAGGTHPWCSMPSSASVTSDQQQPILNSGAAAAATAAPQGSGTSVHRGSRVMPSNSQLSVPPSTPQMQQRHMQAQSQQQQQQQQRQGRQPDQVVQVLLRNVLTPPVVACCLAVPVATVPWLRSALFTPSGDLHLVGEVTGFLGAPLIPCLFLVLGANLAEGPGAAKVPAKLMVGVIISKLVLHPLLGVCAVYAACRTGMIPPGTDPVLVLVMLLVWCTPTAVLTHSLATMLQTGEDEVASFLFWEYLAALLTLPLWLGLQLQLLQSGFVAVL